MKKLYMIGVIVLSLFSVGCNTMAGVGKDVKDAGQAVETSADKHGASR